MRARSFTCLGLILLLFSCSSTYMARQNGGEIYLVSRSTVSQFDSTAYLMAQPYREKLEGQMNRILAHSAQPMDKGQPESRLGNFTADACFEQVSQLIHMTPDFCVLNNGGLRSSLPKGAVTLRNAYELMPFDNTLVILELNGSTTLQLLEFIAKSGGVPVSNLRMAITGGVPSNVMIGQQPFNRERSYKVLTSDYLAGGGDSMEMLQKAQKTIATEILVRDAIISFLEQKGNGNQLIEIETDGRITQ